MTIHVSRQTIFLEDGRKACSRCGRRPRRPGQRYCGPCHAEYARNWRAGTTQMQLTPDEARLIRQLRAGRAVT